MAKVSRPAQGNNSGPLHRPRPAYRKDVGTPTVVSAGSVSRPRDTQWKKSALKRQVADATPKIVKL